jgi:hypothetical protein
LTVWPERKQEGGDEKIIKQERKEEMGMGQYLYIPFLGG